MDIIPAFLCVAAGVALDATYNYLRKKGERKAYTEGYDKAKDEDRLCQRAYDEGRAAEQVAQMRYGVYPSHTPKHAEGKRNEVSVPKSFIEHRNQNGQATMKLK